VNLSSSPRLRDVKCMSPAGFHRMAYAEWGDPDNPRVLVCLHGLTRVGRDFDRLARAMAPHCRVVCPDVVGRGRSHWLRDPNYYVIPQYVSDVVALIARLDVEEVDCVGTSMGGLMGIALAGQADAPVRRLVINDVGPRLDAAAIARIGTYLGAEVSFATVDEAIDYVAVVAAPFGVKKREDWRELVEPALRKDGERWRLHYDPSIAVPFKSVTPEGAAGAEATMWRLYDSIRCPTLLIRGEHSDLLTRETLDEMKGRGPKPATAEVPGVGHAPTFMFDNEIAIVRDFLLG
jgi:pimeloyl-ACP methyl ester carboxylesterase